MPTKILPKISKFEAICAMLIAEAEANENTYVTVYENTNDFVSAYEDSEITIDTLSQNFQSELTRLENGFVVIDNPTSTQFDVYSVDQLLDEYKYQSLIVYRKDYKTGDEMNELAKSFYINDIVFLGSFDKDTLLKELSDSQEIEIGQELTIEETIDYVIGNDKPIPQINGRENFEIIEIVL